MWVIITFNAITAVSVVSEPRPEIRTVAVSVLKIETLSRKGERDDIGVTTVLILTAHTGKKKKGKR